MTPSSSDPDLDRMWRPVAGLSRRERTVLHRFRASEDLADYEVTCFPGTTNTSLLGPAPGGGWGWWVYNSDGLLLEQGHEQSRADAARLAAEAQPLWYHRCAAKGLCRCRKPSERECPGAGG